jgi:hypothetical protein
VIRPIAHFRASQNRLARERLVLSVWMERAAALRNRVDPAATDTPPRPNAALVLSPRCERQSPALESRARDDCLASHVSSVSRVACAFTRIHKRATCFDRDESDSYARDRRDDQRGQPASRLTPSCSRSGAFLHSSSTTAQSCSSPPRSASSWPIFIPMPV